MKLRSAGVLEFMLPGFIELEVYAACVREEIYVRYSRKCSNLPRRRRIVMEGIRCGSLTKTKGSREGL